VAASTAKRKNAHTVLEPNVLQNVCDVVPNSISSFKDVDGVGKVRGYTDFVQCWMITF